ncbi:MAG: hypothetical protein LBI54_05250, partial [Lachnospiraceae bacterium]|nr:hypothetical protein [Lachnospiraceae bacterium]
MDKYKKFCIVTSLSTLLGLLAVAVFVAVIDPFFHYHPPLAGLSYKFDNQNYVNPGIVRQFEYDTLITGTSMTENFRPSVFAEILGANAVKTPFMGGKTKNFTELMARAFAANPALQTVYFGLDLHMLDDPEPALPRDPFPTYLYDQNPLNDVSYLLNKSVLIYNALPFITRTLAGEAPMSFDEYSYWQDTRIPGEFAKRYRLEDSRASASLPRAELLALAKAHLDGNLVPLIAANPQIEFVIFFPPYSIAYWYGRDVDDMLAVLSYAMETLLAYDNVRLFFPMNDAEIVTDLKNYHD